MPVYAPTPRFADSRRHTKALLLIVGAHAVLIAAVMTAKMEVTRQIFDPPTIIRLIEDPPPPPPEPTVQPQPKPAPRTTIDRVPVIVPVPPRNAPIVDQTPMPMPPLQGPIGPSVDPMPTLPQPPLVVEPVRVGPRFVTSPDDVRPPYPESKRRMEQEATLRLRLTIDERGRVIAVDPVGKADPAFLDSARRHILARWRYKPASEDGRPVASATVISLRFELER